VEQEFHDLKQVSSSSFVNVPVIGTFHTYSVSVLYSYIYIYIYMNTKRTFPSMKRPLLIPCTTI